VKNAGDIIVAEDDETDVYLLRRAFSDAGVVQSLHVARDGVQLAEILVGWQQSPSARLPALILLDLKMPRRDGISTLQWIRAQPALFAVPVIIFSSSANRLDVERAYKYGANAFLVKPASLEERATIARFLKEWLRLNQVPQHAL
jgi:CheY-like chemotaxis protein